MASSPAKEPTPRDSASPRLRYQMRVLESLLSDAEFQRQRVEARRLPYRPLISVITPVFNTPPDILMRTLRSVRHQTYPYWEHCLVDDGSEFPWIRRMLDRWAGADPRVRVVKRDHNGGIVAASNDALAEATGEFVALLDHDDTLAPDALSAVAQLLNAHPEADVVYTDFDKLGSDGVDVEPCFKPGWSPELLLSIMYMAHLDVYRRELVHVVGGFREGLDGSQDYDLALRVSERTDRIFHIPRVLYHWGVTPGSMAVDGTAKPYAYPAARRALVDHLARKGIAGTVEDGPIGGSHRVRRQVRGQPLVSIVALADRLPGLATTGRPAEMADTLRRLAERTDYPHYELIVVPRGETDAGRALNAGAAAAHGEHLLFMGEDLEVLSGDWLSLLLEFSQQPGIGAVGAKVSSVHGTIEHAGVAILDGVARRLSVGQDAARPGYLGNLVLPSNCSAVTGACFMTRRSAFDEIGGFAPAATVGYSDVDYCLRLGEHGYRVVLQPFAHLRQRCESITAEPFEGDALEAFTARWDRPDWTDPYYNPNFRRGNPQFVFGVD